MEIVFIKPHHSYQVGKQYTVTDQLGANLVRFGMAEIAGKLEPKPEPEIETAAIPEPEIETAMERPRTKRRRRRNDSNA